MNDFVNINERLELTPKEIFSISFYDALVEAVEKIPDETAKDVYICKLVIHNSGSGNEMASVGLQYNTKSNVKTREFPQIEELSEEYWWGRIPIKIDFYVCQKFLDWRNEIDYDDEDDKYYEFYAIHFKDEMVELCKNLFEEEIILHKFGKNISFLVECECDEGCAIDVADNNENKNENETHKRK